MIPEQQDLVDGSPGTPGAEAGVVLCHPDSGEPIAPSLETEANVVETALASADRIHRQGDWWRLDTDARAATLTRFADALDRRADELAVPESINTGIPISVTSPMTGGLGGFLHGAAERVRGETAREMDGRHGRTVLHRLPFGPAVVIAPWNAPSPTIVGRAAAAMAAGCPVIVKPSEWAPGTADLVAQIALEAELPAGLFQLVHGGARVGQQLVGDRRVRVVSFTGGQPAGQSIAAVASANFTRLQLELGGNNPAIVCADADIEATARSLASGATKLNGQWCEAPGRILADASIADDLREALLAELARFRIGSCLDEETQIGPLSHEPHLLKVRSAIESAAEQPGVTAHHVGSLPDLQGWFLQPTLLTGFSSDVAPPEVFGPVMSLHVAEDIDDALRAANAGDDGLAAYVFSTDIDRALSIGSQVRAGEVKINGTGLFDLCGDSEQSFWGSSGLGGHGDALVDDLFRGSRIVGVDDPEAAM